MTEQEFDIAEVISVAVDILVAPMEGVYRVCNFMTGENVFTHQLPRICLEASPVLLKRHPWLAVVQEESKQVTPQNYREWVARWRDRYGDKVAVPKMTEDEHERIDPISEAAERSRPEQMIVVDPRGAK